MEYDLFSYAISELSIGQYVTVTGKDSLGQFHTKKTVVVKLVTGNEFLTSEGLTFKSSDLTRITISQEFVSEEDLPFLNLTGQLQTFPSEPE